MWSVDDIQKYVQSLPGDMYADSYDETNFVPYESIADFVKTLGNCASHPASAFAWPSESISRWLFLLHSIIPPPPPAA